MYRNAPKKQRCFTLVELLAAMSILLVLMAILFEMFVGAQQAWRLTSRNTEIYQNARIALDLITRDLQAAVASDVPGSEIPFYADKDATPPICAVTAVEPLPNDAKSRLCEVAYKLDTSTNTLQRQCISDYEGSSWDFYGQPVGWQSNTGGTGTAGFNDVIRGVKSFQVKCYKDGSLVTGDMTELPDLVVVSLTLYDPALQDATGGAVAERDKTMRTFSKTVFLGGHN